jgi:hypothetical protein
MGFVASVLLPQVEWAIPQELIDQVAVANSLRMSFWPKSLSVIDGA